MWKYLQQSKEMSRRLLYGITKLVVSDNKQATEIIISRTSLVREYSKILRFEETGKNLSVKHKCSSYNCLLSEQTSSY